MSRIEEIVTEIASPIAEKLGVELVDVEYIKQGAERQLIVYIDKPGGVYIDDCESASREIEAELDRLDPIEESYCLCVSSPGLDRPLKKAKDFERSMGKAVDIKLYKPLSGKKEYTGTLTGYTDGRITIETASGPAAFDLKETALIRLHIDF